MKLADVERLGAELYKGQIRPYKSRQRQHVAELGLDTECYYKKKEPVLLSWQLSLDDKMQSFNTDNLDWQKLYDQSLALLKKQGAKLKDTTLIVHYVYFSTAEGQWLELDDNTHLQQFGAHQVNIRHMMSSRRKMLLFDLSTFFHGKSLGEVAKAFGLEKQVYNVKNLTPANLKDADFIRYAMNDAYIVGEIGRRLRKMLLDSEGIDILLCPTPGAASSAAFRSKHVKEPIKQDWSLLRRQSLKAHGPRKEAFYRGKRDMIFEYDARAMYPNIIRTMGKMPLKDNWRLTTDLDTWVNAKGGIGYVHFKYPESCNTPGFIPVLPVLGKDRLLFPLEGYSHCEVGEAKLALEQGCHIHLFKGFYFNDGTASLADYETDLICKRDANKGTALEPVYKALANSITGKLMQHVEDYDINDLIKHSKETGIPTSIMKQVINLPVKKKLKTGSLFMPEWYYLIVGRARANVARAAIKTNALRIATDCVATTEYQGTEFAINGIEYVLKAAAEDVSYRASLYRTGDNLRYHGASKEVAGKILDEYLPTTPSIEYVTNRITTIKESLNNGTRYGQPYTMKRTVSLKFDSKRFLLPDGTTLPLGSVQDIPQASKQNEGVL